MTTAAGRAAPGPLRFTSAARSDAGAMRALNEDRVLDRPKDGLWAVADGMGGHHAGEVAANRVIEALAAVKHGASGYARLTAVVGAVERVNAELYSQTSSAKRRSGSTLVALLAHEDHYACLWAGDSRAYLLRAGVLKRITQDHSVVQELIDSGLLQEAQRSGHPRSHVITRAVGAGPAVKLDQQFAPIAFGDVFLLCSDGLTACMSDAEIRLILGDGGAAEAADRLLATALERKASDNVSLVVVRVDPA